MNYNYGRMSNPAQRHHFRTETGETSFFIEKFCQELLNRYIALQLLVECTINHTHTPTPDFRNLREIVAFAEGRDKTTGIADHQKMSYPRLKDSSTQLLPSFTTDKEPSPYLESPMIGTTKYSFSGSRSMLESPNM